MLDVTRLRALNAVRLHGSLSAAARALNYTQPAVSHHIRKLEDDLRVRLLDRGPRGVTLTEAGVALALHAEEVLARLARAEEEVCAIASSTGRRVRLASFPSAMATLVPDAIARLAVTQPDCHITLVEAEPPESVSMLAAGDVDVALTFDYDGASAEEIDGYTTVPLRHDFLFAVLAGDHPLAEQGGDLDLAGLAGERWIVGCARCREHLLTACAGVGFAPDVVVATDDYVAVQSLVARSVGVSLLSELALRAYRNPQVTVRPVSPSLGRRVSAVIPVPPVSQGVTALMTALTTAADASTDSSF
ncbi:MAG: LysR family transcriptional regulator [Chloroflexota bacterium]|nr:LysR family transcriptional regulator [Chloroflexota bacterium]